MNDIQIYQTRLFKNQKKKLNKNQIDDLDKAIKSLIENPKSGQQKTGDLSNVWVYKFSMVNQQYLLAYLWDRRFVMMTFFRRDRSLSLLFTISAR